MRNGMTTTRRIALGGAALALSGGALAFGAPAAAAEPEAVHLGRDRPAAEGADAKAPGYSEIQNRAKSNVRVGKNWCGDDTSPHPGGPTCGNDSPQQSLKPGEHSYESAYKDTDTFKVKGGCTMKVQWNWDGEEDADISTHTPKKTTWYKVSNHHDIDIESYKC